MELDAVILKITIILWGLSESPTITNGARILGIFPAPGKSHFSFNEAMMRSLHNAGHEITFVSPFPCDESLKNYSVVDSRNNTPIFIHMMNGGATRDFSYSGLIPLGIEIGNKLCKDVLGSSEIQNLMKSKKKYYDVIFIQLLFMFECYLPLAEKLNIPVIGTITTKSWMFADTAIRNPNYPAAIPSEWSIFSDKMTFLERLENFWQNLYLRYKYSFDISPKLNDIYDQFYSSSLLNKKTISLIFANTHFSFLPRLTVPNMIDVGGIHVKPAKLLPNNYQKFIDEAKHGVILFSLGSMLKSSTLDQDLTNAFRDAFAEIPQQVIWKFEEQIEDLPENILVAKWIPQRDILAHKNVKAFMSHCGMSGTYEALTEGVPMIFTPFLGDQMSNAALLEKLGVGLSLDPFSATKEKVLEALNAIINDTRYRDTMKLVSDRFKDRPMSPQESLVYWTEYVIRHNGAPYMRPVGSDMRFYQYFLLDVIAANAVILIVIVITVAISIHTAVKIIKKRRHSIFNTQIIEKSSSKKD